MKTIKPAKQRKRLHQAHVTARYRRFSAPLSSKLKESYSTNSVPVRKGDTVIITRGDNRGSEGKVTKINRKNYRISIEGVNREKVDGTSISIPIHPSKVKIVRLNLNDKWRKKILERKGEAKKAKVIEEKPLKKEKKAKRKTSKNTKSGGK